jgi:hypothetical protein
VKISVSRYAFIFHVTVIINCPMLDFSSIAPGKKTPFSLFSSAGFLLIDSTLMCLIGYNIILTLLQEDYIKRLSQMLYTTERSQQWVLQVASGPNQQVQMGCEIQPANVIQAIHGGNSSINVMLQVSPSMSSHESQSLHMRSLPITSSGLCPVQEQNMANPVAPIMHTNNRQTGALPMLVRFIELLFQ